MSTWNLGQRLAAVLLGCGLVCSAAQAADHNDPNAVNSIFADIQPDPADLYDMFGFPAEESDGTDRVVLALTFASMPATGVLDPDLLYRVRMYPGPRVVRPSAENASLESMLAYAAAIKDRYLHSRAAEVRVRAEGEGRARVDFIGFPAGDFSETIALNEPRTLKSPTGDVLQVFVGGRDDAFFNDLPGFFRSINYGPQYYLVPHAMQGARELAIPKTLLELEGNALFNFDPARPDHGVSMKEPLPSALTWKGNSFAKNANGNYRFVYSGRDAQAGRNINTVIVELPLNFITSTPKQDRIVNAWGESWVLKAANKVELIPDETRAWWRRLWDWIKSWFSSRSSFEEDLQQYKRVDTDGVPFADAALNERIDERQIGADNETLARQFAMRLGHLGWGFGPSISALGLGTCFDHDNSPVSIDRTYKLATEAFPRIKKCLFQEVNMPDGSWNKRALDIPLKRSFEIFIPNVCAVDMDTTGTWPYGRRLEDQVANRFLTIFLDMQAGCGGGKCNVESFSQQALWDAAPIEPKTSPNPLLNDVPFLTSFPYLADPH